MKKNGKLKTGGQKKEERNEYDSYVTAFVVKIIVL